MDAREKNIASANFSPALTAGDDHAMRFHVVIPRNRRQQRLASDVPLTATEEERWEGALNPLFYSSTYAREVAMSDRLVTGAVAALAAILTLVQLLWMFGMFSPADALGGRNGALYASALAAWFFITLAPLVAAAILLLMTRDDTKTRA